MGVANGHRDAHRALQVARRGVLRVDFEMGRWVGTLYAPSLTIKTQIVGSDVQVHAWAAGLAA
jgi:hypothetical protein